MKLSINIAEKNLIRRCCKGDSKAQFEIYKQYYKGMYSVAFRILNNTAEAEDIMQEAFLTAFDKLDAFSAEGSFGGWLKKIVLNRSLDALRKRKMQFEDIDERTTCIPDDEDETRAKMEKVEMIKYLISQMNDKNRVLLNLHLIEGYPHEEIAEMLNMNHGAVRTGYIRAKKKLQDELAKVMAY